MRTLLMMDHIEIASSSSGMILKFLQRFIRTLLHSSTQKKYNKQFVIFLSLEDKFGVF